MSSCRPVNEGRFFLLIRPEFGIPFDGQIKKKANYLAAKKKKKKEKLRVDRGSLKRHEQNFDISKNGEDFRLLRVLKRVQIC